MLVSGRVGFRVTQLRRGAGVARGDSGCVAGNSEVGLMRQSYLAFGVAETGSTPAASTIILLIISNL